MVDKIKVVIVSHDVQTQKVLKLYLDEYNSFDVQEFEDIYRGEFSAGGNEPSIFVVDSSKNEDVVLGRVLELTSHNPLARVLVLSDDMSVDLIVRSMRVGAKEFLPLPLIKSEFKDAIDRLLETFNVPHQRVSKCKVISVFSNKGGIGKTSIATNLALELADITKERVALIDLNFRLGDITTFLDLNPSFNISYILENFDRINDEFLMSTLERYKKSSLYVLADSPILKETVNISAKRLTGLFSVLKESFSFIVIDADSSFEDSNVAVLSESDLLLLVTVANLPALRNVQRCNELFDRLGFDVDKVKLLLNRYMENDEVKESDIEEVTGKDIYWKLPNNYFTVMSAINKGVPVCIDNPSSNIATSYRNLALKIVSEIYVSNTKVFYNNKKGGNIGVK